MKYGCNACGAYVEAGGGHDCYRQSPTMTALTWTRERPTQPGWWWVRIRKAVSSEWYEPDMAYVTEGNGSLWCETMGGLGPNPLDRYTYCEWYGPLVPPSP